MQIRGKGCTVALVAGATVGIVLFCIMPDMVVKITTALIGLVMALNLAWVVYGNPDEVKALLRAASERGIKVKGPGGLEATVFGQAAGGPDVESLDDRLRRIENALDDPAGAVDNVDAR